MPSAPYCDSGDVFMMRKYLENPSGTDFRVDGTPPKAAIVYWIDQVASQIDMAYASAGYEIPLTAISGETWPTHQTTFLQYFNAIGVASMIGGDATTPPLIDFIRGRRVTRSFYEYEWTRLIEGAQGLARRQLDTSVLLRAATISGSPADYLLSEPTPPLFDFLEGYPDPTLHDRLREFTMRNQFYDEEVNRYNQPSSVNWQSIEYLYLLHERLGLTYDN